MSEPVPVAILGATGYAGELSTRILLAHPGFRIVHAGSDRLAGTPLGEAVPAFAGATDLELRPDTADAIRESGARAIVLCKKSPEVTPVVPELLAAGIRIVDIGAEFRLRDIAAYDAHYEGPHACPELLAEAVYGLCEWHTEAIKQARVVGNPGCYTTTILTPLLPLLRAQLVDLDAPLVCTAYSGVSGAGKRFLESNNNLFWAMNENLRPYRTLAHQHRAELDQECSLAAGTPLHVHFAPHLAPITRGILATLPLRLRDGVDAEAVIAAWRTAYHDRPFVRIRSSTNQIEVSTVAGTNHVDIACVVDDGLCMITSALDNLVKGAAGQAVQNLNLMFGYPETDGLLGRTFI